MNIAVRKQITSTASEALLRYSISEALDAISTLAHCCKETNIKIELEELYNNYNFMLDFLGKGGKDESRNNVQLQIILQSRKLLNKVDRSIRLQTQEDYYSKTFLQLQKNYGTEIEKVLLSKWANSVNIEERLNLQDDIFDLLWTSGEWNDKDTAKWYEFITRQDELVRRHFMGGIILSAWEYFDEEKIAFIKIFLETEREESYALVSSLYIMLILKYNEELKMNINKEFSLREKIISKTLPLVLREYALMMRTLVSLRKQQEELSKLNTHNMADLAEMFNIHTRNAKYRLKNGLDYNIDKVSMLHACPFLKRISHWWLPYEPSHPLAQKIQVGANGKEYKELTQCIYKLHDCDVDKYAFCSSLNESDSSVLQLIDQMSAHIQEQGITSNRPGMKYKLLMQSLYRFFAHSPLKDQVISPFKTQAAIFDFETIYPLLKRNDIIQLSKMLYDAEMYTDANFLVQQLIQQEGADTELLNHNAQCLIRLGQFKDALNKLAQAGFLVEEEEEESLKMKAFCYAQLRMQAEELACLQKLSAIHPEDYDLQKDISVLLVDTGQYQEAYDLLCKLHYTSPEETAHLLLLVKCAIMLGNLKTAERFSQAMLQTDEGEKWETSLLAGHTYFIMQNWVKALSFYKQFTHRYAKQVGISTNPAIIKFDEDTPLLSRQNISFMDIQLMRDLILKGNR